MEERFTMKPFVSLMLLMSLIVTHIKGQKVSGFVRDSETGAAVPFADIYVEGTFTGTVSDSNGHFRLNISDFPHRSITVSAIGYYSVAFPSKPVETDQVIHLVPRRYELQEVTIGAPSLKRERTRNLKLFRREFLGTSTTARGCEILYESGIRFPSKNQDILILRPSPGREGWENCVSGTGCPMTTNLNKNYPYFVSSR